MFTGLIEATGRIEASEPDGVGRRLRIGSPFATDVRAGDSVAVNGVCVTALVPDTASFEADLSPATLAATTLGRLAVGDPVNLERPLRADARLGGHFVLGHVDGVGRIVDRRSDGLHTWFEVELPLALAPYVIDKGSVAIDGISLTVARLAGPVVGLQIVPFTLAHTTLAEATVGREVNVEADVLGKYVARLLSAHAGTPAMRPSLP